MIRASSRGIPGNPRVTPELPKTPDPSPRPGPTRPAIDCEASTREQPYFLASASRPPQPTGGWRFKTVAHEKAPDPLGRRQMRLSQETGLKHSKDRGADHGRGRGPHDPLGRGHKEHQTPGEEVRERRQGLAALTERDRGPGVRRVRRHVDMDRHHRLPPGLRPPVQVRLEPPDQVQVAHRERTRSWNGLITPEPSPWPPPSRRAAESSNPSIPPPGVRESRLYS